VAKRLYVVPTGDDSADTFQRKAKTVVGSVQDSPILNGVLKENISLTTVTTAVPHGLGRTPKGFIVVDCTVAVDVARDAASSVDRTVFIPLAASVATTVSLWIF
jgi:hypothetical protein